MISSSSISITIRQADGDGNHVIAPFTGEPPTNPAGWGSKLLFSPSCCLFLLKKESIVHGPVIVAAPGQSKHPESLYKRTKSEPCWRIDGVV